MKPTKGTVQWIAPHLSESEVRAIYEMVLEAIGKPVQEPSERIHVSHFVHTIQCISDLQRWAIDDEKIKARKAAAVLFGMEKS